MNQEYLDSLVGLNVKDVEDKVRKDGYDFSSHPAGTISCAITRPDNQVEVYYDAKDMVVSAFNQRVCDEKYA